MTNVKKEIRSAVILAAGMGSRLREVIGDKPKGLLVIDEKEIIKRSLDCLQNNGISDIVMVLGYLREKYIQALQKEYPQIKYVYNPDYTCTGSMHSLFLAREHLTGDFLLLESDLLYEKRCISSLITGKSDEAILISGTTHSGDEVYVHGQAGLINRIAKKKDPQLISQGELVGISKISAALYEKMCAYYEHVIPFPSDYHYEDCLSDLSTGQPIPYLKIEDLIWTEIDDPSHYRRALEQIYPKICAKEALSTG
ncbi:MAG: phosphocholine cytidylyltransferase family protein [SAR324 cluster bacterium]|nr:phosphocholine cytidylyltransferase family protein [SAR324 cluster bacterium]